MAGVRIRTGNPVQIGCGTSSFQPNGYSALTHCPRSESDHSFLQLMVTNPRKQASTATNDFTTLCLMKHRYVFMASCLSIGIRLHGVVLNEARGYVFMTWRSMKHRDTSSWRGAQRSAWIRLHDVVLNETQGYVFMEWCSMKHGDTSS
jgi:hypothetical protein